MSARCQSCGMPMSKDPAGGGTEFDGSRSSLWCSLCYDHGAFRHPGMTLPEFRAHCIDQLAAKGMPRILAWAFTRGMGRLARWQAT